MPNTAPTLGASSVEAFSAAEGAAGDVAGDADANVGAGAGAAGDADADADADADD